jgi:nitric oxide dioxygenase
MGQVNTSSSWQKVQVVDTIEIASKTREITLKYPSKFSFTPGQYIKIRIREKKVNEERYYSVCSAGAGNLLKIAVERVENGNISKVIHKLKIGDMVEIKGPMGSHFLLNKQGSLFISGGIGITPFMSAQKEVMESSIFLSSFREKDDIPWLNDLKNMKGVRIFLTSKSKIKPTDTGSKFTFRRMNLNDIKEALLSLQGLSHSIYICGGTAFVEDIKNLIEKSDLKNYEVFTEMFG